MQSYPSTARQGENDSWYRQKWIVSDVDYKFSSTPFLFSRLLKTT